MVVESDGFDIMGLFSDLDDTIYQDKDVLKEDYQPDEILEREAEIEEYKHALSDAIFGRTPDNVFLFGKSGVGKTAVTNYVLAELEGEALHGERLSVEYGDEDEFEVAGHPATQTDLRVIDADRSVNIEVTETTSVVGHLASAQGDIGLAAVYQCSQAHNLGVPTLLYTDERITLGDLDERYHDLSAE